MPTKSKIIHDQSANLTLHQQRDSRGDERRGDKGVPGKLRVLSLFAGIGGFDLGLERTGGFETVAFCEINEFCRRVLAKNWPRVPCYEDVRALTADTLARDGIAVDVIVGGFPCQDLSFAGKRAGLEGERSGLWGEYARLIRELRPSYVIVENVPGLLSLGLGDVLGALAASGYDAVWDCIPAAAVGAPHRRDRFWLVAHAAGGGTRRDGEGRQQEPDRRAADLADAQGFGGRPGLCESGSIVNGSFPGYCGAYVPHRNGERPERRRVSNVSRQALSDAFRRGETVGRTSARSGEWWAIEPAVGRVAHGVPSRVDRLRALGNAVVPQIPELIGRAILQSRSAA